MIYCISEKHFFRNDRLPLRNGCLILIFGVNAPEVTTHCTIAVSCTYQTVNNRAKTNVWNIVWMMVLGKTQPPLASIGELTSSPIIGHDVTGCITWCMGGCECFSQSQCTVLPRTNSGILHLTWLLMAMVKISRQNFTN